MKDFIKVTNNNVRFFGRVYKDTDLQAYFFNWTCSGFEVSFKGTCIEAELLTVDISNEFNMTYISVLVDNDKDPHKANIIRLDTQKGIYVLAENLEDTVHTIKVLKRSECSLSKSGISKLRCDGTLLDPPKSSSDLKIEFIGDSITCGFGNVSDEPGGKFSTSTEDGLQSYAYLTAINMNAQATIFAVSGWAINKSPYGKSIPEVYAKTDPFNDTKKRDWNFEEHQVDVVVLALGTNDKAYANKEDDKLREFEDKYYKFLMALRENYKSAYIICILGTLIEDGHPIINHLQNAVKKAADPKTQFIKLNKLEQSDGYGCGHPTFRTHIKDAAKLTDKLKSILSLNSYTKLA